MPIHESDDASRLRAELEEVTRREVSFRLKTVKDFFSVESKSRELAKTLDEKNVYIHQLHLEGIELRKALQEAHADIEAFTWMLHANERDAAMLKGLKKSAVWPLVKNLAQKPPKDAESPAPAGSFKYFLHTSPYRLYRADNFTLRGWLLPNQDATVTAVRVRIAGKTFQGNCGLPEPEVIKEHGPQPKNPQPGFTVTYETPEGRHAFALEAQLNNEAWYSVLSAPIWSRRT